MFLEFSGFYILSNLQLSRFFVVGLFSSNFYILSQSLAFVNNFFKFLFFVFADCLSEYQWYHTQVFMSTTFFNNSQKLFRKMERRKRDLNPRAGFPTYTLSRGASSASWVFLRIQISICLLLTVILVHQTHVILY